MRDEGFLRSIFAFVQLYLINTNETLRHTAGIYQQELKTHPQDLK